MQAIKPIALLLLLASSAMAQDRQALGIAAFDRGDYASAEKLLAEIDTPSAKAVLALTKAATGHCAEAEPVLAANYTDAKLRRLAGIALARCLIAAQRFDEAAQPLAKLEREFPDDPDILYENARLHLKAWNGAVERMFEKVPASFRVNQLSAEIFEIQGRYDEAVAEYRKAIRKSPDTLALHYRLGRALLLRSHEPEALSEARREFEAELNVNPYDAVAHYQIAQILEVQQQPDAAAKELERTLELSPDFPEALVALARYRSRGDNHVGAITLLERVVKLQPASESSWYALMVAYRNSGRNDDAVAAKQKLDALQQSTAGEFSDFLRRIGETPQP
ncbi:MAG: tetratricopeptide repeat protein [Acidobacteria bacterium]|nr:tetratricopeptide repeat protein [Acidobacteriota bacterium]MDA1233894.1 tetratricopeptide repeat protein [Acidobacteriota bacterium]